jgi:hypothetical protein
MKIDGKNKIILILSLPLVFFVIVASSMGLFVGGAYSKETVSWKIQAIGQDAIDLFLISPFLIITMFSHRIISLGAVVAAMIAKCGDASFVLLAMIPEYALMLTFLLFMIGIGSAALSDSFVTNCVTLKMNVKDYKFMNSKIV